MRFSDINFIKIKNACLLDKNANLNDPILLL